MAAPRPFLKWAGGKHQLLPELRTHVPKWYQTYREPFLGGGALFFELRPIRAVLSDWNPELMTTFVAVRDAVELLISLLQSYEAKHGPKLYEELRRLPFSPDRTSVSTAARMIYLNKTCFNGLYRVNSDGHFNVPMGKFRTPPTICDAENLRACSEALRYAQIHNWDFQYALRQARSGDLVYCDPPYLPSSDTANFTGYTDDKFGVEDHEALAWSAAAAKRRGAHVLLSSAGNEKSREVYRDFQLREVESRRAINSKADARGAVREFLCT